MSTFLDSFSNNNSYSGDSSPWGGTSTPSFAPDFSVNTPSMSDSFNFGSAVNPYAEYSQSPSWGTPMAGVPTYSGGDIGGGAVASAPTDSSHWYSGITDALSKQWESDPLKVLGTLGMGGLTALGSAMNAKNSNKLAKQVSAQNAAKVAYDSAMMNRSLTNAAIADKYNNSYDVTAPATVTTNQLTPYEAAHYGETGGRQQIAVTPGDTTRVQLAEGGMVHGYAQGGQADNVPAMLSEGEFVIPADVVSALGDGSTKAGASALNQMMQEVRNMVRSAPNNSIPQEMTSPLSMLKGGE